MSTTISAPVKSADARPWHGHENPFEAMYLHFTAEIAALKRAAAPAPVPVAPPPRPVMPAQPVQTSSTE